jgi:hypothetical protein
MNHSLVSLWRRASHRRVAVLNSKSTLERVPVGSTKSVWLRVYNDSDRAAPIVGMTSSDPGLRVGEKELVVRPGEIASIEAEFRADGRVGRRTIGLTFLTEHPEYSKLDATVAVEVIEAPAAIERASR